LPENISKPAAELSIDGSIPSSLDKPSLYLISFGAGEESALQGA
jgi:hypothetical protein